MTGPEVRAIRQKLGLTQAELAPLIGYASSDSVSKLEREERPSAAVALLLRAYAEGRLPIDWLA